MPRILIDISRLCYRRLAKRLPTGIDRVSLEYIRHYADRARAVLTRGPFSSVLSRPDSVMAFDRLLDPAAGAATWAARLLFKACLRWWTSPDVAECVLLNTGHSGLEDPGYALSLRRRGAPPVIFVHDLIPITHPEYFPAGERDRHATRMRTALTVGRGIIVNSQSTLDELGRFAREAGLGMPPAVVAPLASSLPKTEAGPRPITAPYFVVVGTIEPRKNHLLLLQIWRKLVSNRQDLLAQNYSKPVKTTNGHLPPSYLPPQSGEGDIQDLQDSNRTKANQMQDDLIPRLVVIGHRGHESENVADLLDRCRELRGFVIEKSRCSDAELVTYLRHARALLFPTFVEGYGIPVAEALALGTPVIAADLPVFREVAGEIPEYAGPLDGKRWMELIADYAGTQSVKRAAQLERMKGFQPTTWAQHFEKVDDFLKKEIGNSK